MRMSLCVCKAEIDRCQNVNCYSRMSKNVIKFVTLAHIYYIYKYINIYTYNICKYVAATECKERQCKEHCGRE